MAKKEKQTVGVGERLHRAVDGAVGLLSPERATRRQVARARKRLMEKVLAGGRLNRLEAQVLSGGFRHSHSNRLNSRVSVRGGSADADILLDLDDLRQQSRDLVMNDGHAAGIVNSYQTNVVGLGMRPQSRIDAKRLGLSDDRAKELQSQAERIYEKWSTRADASDRLNQAGLEWLAVGQILENGEALFVRQMIDDDPWRPYKLAWLPVESDRLGNPDRSVVDGDWRSGVEIGGRNQPLRYAICQGHPGDAYISGQQSTKYDLIPRRDKEGRLNVIHAYAVKRPGQTRGYPFFAPILNYFRQHGEYMEAELVGARAAACFAAFITRENSADWADGISDESDGDGNRIEALYPGMMEYLDPGESIEFANPNRPGGQFEPFVSRILRTMSVGMNVPYEIVSGDFSGVNYSTLRGILLQARAWFRVLQDFIVRSMSQPSYELCLEEAFIRGEFDVPDFYRWRYEYTRARWIPMVGWRWVDPLKEVKASLAAVKGNLSTLADEAASQDKDWEATLEQRAREMAVIRELGLDDEKAGGETGGLVDETDLADLVDGKDK